MNIERIDGKLWIVKRNPRNLAEYERVEPCRIVYSPTGQSHGSGTDRYRWVSYLTAEERQLVKDGHIVVIDNGVPLRAPLPIQVVIYRCGRFDHRVPDKDIEQECLKVAGY